MKKNIYRANYTILHSLMVRVFNEGLYANKLLEREFKTNKKLGARDRKFLAENIYDIVRWWRKLLAVCGLEDSHFKQKNLFHDGDFDYVLSAWFTINGWDLPDFLEKYSSAAKKAHGRWQKNNFEFAVQHSYCDFFAGQLQRIFGENARNMASHLNQQAQIYIRVNTNNISKNELIVELAREDVKAEEVSEVESCLRIIERKNLFITECFKKGYFEVQDKGSQAIAPLLDVSPGQRVVDACAGAGGKTLHLANLMNNKGKIIALDIHAWKLQELKLRARRNRVSIIEGKSIENSKVIKRMKNQADRLLLDVPCTGSGVIKRNPDSKWKFSEKRLEELVQIQTDIISGYSQMVKAGGKMVYATCSLFPEENQEIVSGFLAQNESHWRLEKELLISPEVFNSDGFYAALMIKL